MYNYLHKPWCPDSALCQSALPPRRTPELAEQPPPPVPVTPEPARPLQQDLAVTQDSSPRKGRTASTRKRARENRMHSRLHQEPSLRSLLAFAPPEDERADAGEDAGSGKRPKPASVQNER